MRRHTIFLLAAGLLAGCSTPSFLGDNIQSDASFLGEKTATADGLTLTSTTDYPTLESDIDSILQEHHVPPPVTVSRTAIPANSSVHIPAPDTPLPALQSAGSAASDIRIDIPAPAALSADDYSRPAPVASRQDNHDHAENSPGSRAHAYLKALFRGDGEGAWRYATVPANPRESWWDSNTAKGALLMKAGSSEYFAAEKQGVSRIDIPPHAIQQQGNDARLVAQITYGNGSHSAMNLHLINERGQWLVAEE